MSRRIAVSKIFTAVLLGVTVGLSAQSSQPAAPAAEALLAPAFTRAAKEGKSVLIDFGAKTWCVPCFKLRAFLTAPEIAPIVGAHFVVVELTVWESKGNLHLNNAGAEVLMQQWGPVGGIPFVALADANRRVLATSVSAGFGGYPADPSEIEVFARFLSTAAPRMTPGERTNLTNWLSTRADKFGSVAGRVLGGDGQPFVKAVVSLVERVYADGRWRPVQKQTVTTDVAGRYALERVSPGSYRVMVDAPPSAAAAAAGLSTAAATFFPSTTRFAESTDVVVVAGQDLLDLDVTLLLASPRRVAGLALGADRRALSGAAVSLTNVDWPATSYTATTRADGAFSVAGVRPGRYHVWVQSAPAAAQPREIGSASIDLLKSDVLDLRIASSVGATLSGILTIEGGTVPPEDRAAIRVAAIALEPAPGAPGILRLAPVDDARRFEVRGLFGKRIVRVSNLPAGWVLGSVRRDGVDITDRAIEIGSEARDVHNLEIVLRRGAQISGTLEDSVGQPGKTGAVIVFAADASRWTYPSRFLKNAPVQNDGTFAVRGLPSGRYLLAYVASLPSDWDSKEALESLLPRATPVEVGDQEDRRLTIVAKDDSTAAAIAPQSPVRAKDPIPVTWTIAMAPYMKAEIGPAFNVILNGTIEPGWHLYALAQPPGGPVPLSIDMPKAQVFSRAGAVVEPTPRKSIDANFNGLMTVYFEESAAFTVPVGVAPGTKPGRHPLQVNVEHQLCNAKLCLPPAAVELKLEVPVGASPAAGAPSTPASYPDEPGLDAAIAARSLADPDARLAALEKVRADFAGKPVWSNFDRFINEAAIRTVYFHYPERSDAIALWFGRLESALANGPESDTRLVRLTGIFFNNDVVNELIEKKLILGHVERSLESAIRALQGSTRPDDAHPDTTEPLSFGYARLGDIAFARGDLKAGHERYRDAFRRAPSNGEVAARLMRFYVSRNEASRAEQTAREIVRDWPGTEVASAAALAVADDLVTRSQHEQAERWLADAVAVNRINAASVGPFSARATLALARLENRRGAASALDHYMQVAGVQGSRSTITDADRAAMRALYQKVHGREQGLDAEIDEIARSTSPIASVARYKPTASRTTRTVLLEMMTGSGCGPCVADDLALDAVARRYAATDVVILNYHLNAPQPDPMATSGGEARGWDYVQSNGVPTMKIDGQGNAGFGGRREYAEFVYRDDVAAIDKALEVPTSVKVTATATIQGDVVRVRATASGVPASVKNPRLHLVLAERELSYASENGMRLHPMVVRAVAGDKGEGLPAATDGSFEYSFSLAAIRADVIATLAADIAKRRTRPTPAEGAKKTFYAEHHAMATIDPSQLVIVAFVQDGDKRVLQATQADVRVVSAQAQAQAPAVAPQRDAAPRPHAEALLTAALTEARGATKIVWVDFSASWCGPCLRILRFLDAPEMRPILSKHFVIVPLTAGETGDRAARDHPGALALKGRLGGGIGLPYYVFLDASGKTLASFDSVPFPARGGTKDATAFVDQLARLAPRLTPAERLALVGFLAKP